ncbi:UNVERIFIED_CONTAM: hypothetical protein Sradi_1445900, partial [Sesamum radiatum]
FPGDNKPGSREELVSQKGRLREKENLQNRRFSPNSFIGNSSESDEKMEDFLIDLNARPPGLYDRAANNQEQADTLVDNDHASETMVPNGYFREEPENQPTMKEAMDTRQTLKNNWSRNLFFSFGVRNSNIDEMNCVHSIFATLTLVQSLALRVVLGEKGPLFFPFRKLLDVGQVFKIVILDLVLVTLSRMRQ